MIQQYILTVPKHGELDTYGDLDVAFNYVFDDPENISERRSSFSKTIFLPNTPRNATFFKYYFGLTIEDSYDTRKKVKCDVRMGSDNVFPGFLKLISVQNDFEDIKYEVNIISHDIALSDDIGDDNMSVIDMSEFNHIRNKENIINSWDTSIKQGGFDVPFQFGNGYVYTDIVYGNDQDIYNRRKVYDLFPGIYDYTLIQKIFQHYGRTVVSDFLETDYFKSLVIPFTKDKLALDDEEKAKRELFVGIPTGSSPIDLGISMERDPDASQNFKNTAQSPTNVFQFTDESTLDFNDGGGNFYGSYWMPSKQGRYNISFNGKMLIEYTSFNGNDFEFDSGTMQYYYRMWLRRTDGSEVTISDSGASSSNPFGQLDFAPSDNASHASPWLDTGQQLVLTMNASDVFMNPGDIVYVQLFFKHPGDTDWNIDSSIQKKVTAKPLLFRDFGGDLSFFKVELNNNIMMANEEVNMNAILPEMKIKDYLNNLIKEFNLVFVADKDDPYLIRVEPIVNYLKTRNRVIDLTNRLDNDQTKIKTPTTEMVARNFIYSHSEDADYFNDQYQDESGKVFGQQVVFTDNEFNNTDDTTQVTWAATPSAQRYFIDRITPYFCTIDADETLKPKSVKPRHLFYNGLKTCNYWIMEDYKDDPTYEAFFYYPQIGMWDDMTNPTTTLEFGPSDKTYYNTNVFPNNNLFNMYHRDYLQSIIDKDAYILKANFWLDSAMIADLDYRDIIHVEGVDYRILKINGYNPIAYDKTTEVELLKIVDFETYFTKYSDVPLAHFYCPVDVQLAKTKTGFVYMSKSGQTISKMCCDSLGGDYVEGTCRMKSIGASPDSPIKLQNHSTEGTDTNNGSTNTVASPSITATGTNIYTAAGSSNLNLLGENISANSNTTNAMAIGTGITMTGENMLVVGENINAVGPGLWIDNINGIPTITIFNPTLDFVLLNGNQTLGTDIEMSTLTNDKIVNTAGTTSISMGKSGSLNLLEIISDGPGDDQSSLQMDSGDVNLQSSNTVTDDVTELILQPDLMQLTSGNNTSGNYYRIILEDDALTLKNQTTDYIKLNAAGIFIKQPATDNTNTKLLSRDVITGIIEEVDASLFVAQNLDSVLTVGNLTGGNNILMTSGDVISSTDTFSTLSLDTNLAVLAVDAGAGWNSVLGLTDTIAAITFNNVTDNSAVSLDGASIKLNVNGDVLVIEDSNINVPYVPTTDNAQTKLVVRNSTTGDIELRDVSSLPSTGTQKYAATVNLAIGNNTITHSLGTSDVTIQIRDASGNMFIPNSVGSYTSTNLVVNVASAITGARVVVIG